MLLGVWGYTKSLNWIFIVKSKKISFTAPNNVFVFQFCVLEDNITLHAVNIPSKSTSTQYKSEHERRIARQVWDHLLGIDNNAGVSVSTQYTIFPLRRYHRRLAEFHGCDQGQYNISTRSVAHTNTSSFLDTRFLVTNRRNGYPPFAG